MIWLDDLFEVIKEDRLIRVIENNAVVFAGTLSNAVECKVGRGMKEVLDIGMDYEAQETIFYVYDSRR